MYVYFIGINTPESKRTLHETLPFANENQSDVNIKPKPNVLKNSNPNENSIHRSVNSKQTVHGRNPIESAMKSRREIHEIKS